MRICLGFLLFFLLSFTSNAQKSFWRNDSIKVIIGPDTLLNPWTGGLNFCQFSEIDLNMDGINDLFVFDRQGTNGGRITTFINIGTPNKVSYVNAPQYAAKFPPLHDWALLADYNCDGKADIFTSTLGGIKLYKNTSTVAGGLSFQIADTLLRSTYLTTSGPTGPYNLYVNSTDIPAIVDVDGDGDLDILTYENGLHYIEYHKNMSLEKYGTCDSLNAFVKQIHCFGAIEDNASTACQNYLVFVSDSCIVNSPPPHPDTIQATLQHSGNCILCINEDGDKDRDLLLGHIGCSSITELKNTGDTSFAKFTSADYSFPSYDVPVKLNIFACGYLVDVDNDGKKDVLYSPDNYNEGAAEDFHSVVWYKNKGTNDSTVLNFRQNNFLQDQMIDVGEGAFPVVRDYDGDGLADLFIGNFGYYDSVGVVPQIALFKNTGTSTKPQFTLITRDFANLSSLHLGLTQFAPTFGDLDGDGDADMVLGDYQGHLYYFEKQSGAPDNYSFVPNFFPNVNVTNYATPQLIDLNRDGKLDLVVGARNGNIYYYQNSGTTTSPVFPSIPTSKKLGGINTNKPGYPTGYAAPFFYDAGGSYQLLVGTENGAIQKYGNIDGNLGGNFTSLDPLVAYIGEGERSVPFGYDINGDGLMDMFVGNFSGGLEFYEGSSALGIVMNHVPESYDFSVFPNPASSGFTLVLNHFEPGEKPLFTISDVLGRTLMSSEISSLQTTYSTSSLPPGSYFCSVLSEKGLRYHKLLIRK
jgi:hypothetical protein